jgi:hypothetical protein
LGTGIDLAAADLAADLGMAADLGTGTDWFGNDSFIDQNLGENGTLGSD